MTQMHVRHLVEKEAATGEMWRNDLVLRCEKPEVAHVSARLFAIGSSRRLVKPCGTFQLALRGALDAPNRISSPSD